MPDKLCVVISSADSRVIKTALQYARRTITEKFMVDTKLFFFGPSEATIAAEKEVQDVLRRFIEETGRKPMACKWCSDDYQVTDALKNLGIEVDYIGVHVSGAIREGYVPMVW